MSAEIEEEKKLEEEQNIDGASGTIQEVPQLPLELQRNKRKIRKVLLGFPIRFIRNIWSGSFLRKTDINNRLLTHKTPLCDHEGGCIDSIVAGSLRSFLVGYSFKVFINVIGALIKYRVLLKK